MLFNSWQFIVFFALVYAIYVFLPGPDSQNWLLLISSYYFYAVWDWRFIFLIFGMTLVNYTAGYIIGNTDQSKTRKYSLIICLIINLGALGFFKYFNFFIGSLDELIGVAGFSMARLHLNIILPVGISFYTFQVMSYTIDIYRGELKPTTNFVQFALFVALFTQLVAGPIERAKRLLPQIKEKRQLSIERFGTAFWLIFWGLYKKIVIADNMAIIVDRVFENSVSATVAVSYLGVFAFAIQIYCDFSAYTDIARGCARLLGFDLMRNFNLPYFAENPREFWKRWHISLSTWLRDYLYISLGGNRKGKNRTYVNLMLTMILGGLWHGPAWNFVWWGLYHGVLLAGHRLLLGYRVMASCLFPKVTKSLKILIMFHFTLFGWLLFRSTRKVSIDGGLQDDSLRQIMEFLFSFQNGLGFDYHSYDLLQRIIFLTLPLAIMQLLQIKLKDHYFILNLKPAIFRASIYSILIFTWLIWGVQSGDSFIYFQF